jgi:hypothetical protein
MENAYKILVGKHEGNIPLEKIRLRWKDNIKLDLKRIAAWGYGLDLSRSG